MKNRVYFASFLLMTAILNSTAAAYSTEDTDIKERYGIYYDNAVTLFKEKKYTSAINEFKKVLRFVPYDTNVNNALYTTYLARAEYFLNTEKQPKKAINDLKSALFYMKYWMEENKGADISKISAAEIKLSGLLKIYENLGTDAKYANAKNLRSQGEIAAAGYDLNKLKSTGGKYEYDITCALSDIYKSLNNRQMAIENVRSAVKLKPENALAHYKYALILDDIQNFDAANDEYSLAFKYADTSPEVQTALENLWIAKAASNPKNAEALINLGALYQKQKQYDLARAQYIKAQDINPNDPVALTNLASLHLETKNYQEALNIYDTMLSKNPNDLKLLLYKADVYKKLGDSTNALNEYNKILAIQSSNIDAKNGINSIVSNLSGDALVSYLKENALNNPYDYDKQFGYAYELHKNKSYTDAISFYKKAIALNPKMPEPYINIGQIYRLQNDSIKADAAISHGLSNIPDNKELLSMKKDIQTEEAGNLYSAGLKYFNDGDYKTALENYLKIKIQTPEVLYSIASCYFELDNNEKAIEYFKLVLEKMPNDTKAMYFIANSYVNMQNTPAAIEYLNKILSIEPNNKDAKIALTSLKQGIEGKDLDMAISFYENKNYKECLAVLDKILTSNPKNAYAHYYKGAVYEDTKNIDGAIAEYKKATDADANFSLAYYMLAIALDTKEKYNEAIPYYNRYLALKSADGTEDDSTRYVKSRLKELKDYLGQK